MRSALKDAPARSIMWMMKTKLNAFLTLTQTVFVLVLIFLLLVFFAPVLFGERKPVENSSKPEVTEPADQPESEKPTLDDFR